jgi:hypothetical protein
MIIMSERFSRHGFHASRFKALLLVLVVTAASVAGVYAYLKSLQVQTGPSATITSLPLEFSISLDKGTFQLGENFSIHFLLKNVGNQTVTLTKPTMGGFDIGAVDNELEGTTFSNYPNAFHFELMIKSSNGTLVDQIGPGVWQSLYVIRIEPSGYLKQTLHLGYFYQKDYGVPFPKGIYELTGQFNARWGESSNSVNLETPSITLTIG